jgi:hypothetical protein
MKQDRRPKDEPRRPGTRNLEHFHDQLDELTGTDGDRFVNVFIGALAALCPQGHWDQALEIAQQQLARLIEPHLPEDDDWQMPESGVVLSRDERCP